MGAFSGWNFTSRPQLRLVVGGRVGSVPSTPRVVELRSVAGLRAVTPLPLGGRSRRRHKA